jgi:cystathionine beta-lyase/cystathionine gamma-synthase
MNWREQSLQTRVIHAGDPRPRVEGALVLPIFQSTVFEQRDDRGYHDVVYPRLNNLPNHVALGEKLSALEGAEAATVTSSGMAAISTTLLSVLAGQGHLLIQDQQYGGTHMLVSGHFSGLGFTFDFIDPEDPKSWRSKLRPDTRAIYTETLTNPLVQVIDHTEVVRFARENELVSVIDNTFATPINYRPIENGYDVAVHSATKYLNGHSDLVAGAIVGSRRLIEPIVRLQNELGGSLDPHGVYLLNRGVKTLALRVRQHNANSLALAKFLEGHAAVRRVNHPGLETHPHHRRAKELFDGFGGMLSFELAGGVEAAERFFDRARIPTAGPSLGGVETLVTRPATTSHVGLTGEERQALGIGDALIRVSVGIEDENDLIADFDQAIA